MPSSSDDTVLPPRRRANASGLDGDTVLPSQNAAGIHAAGDVIDNRYTVIREIGRGGMGVVYEVEDDLVGIRVAVKRLLPELAQRADLIEVFKREGSNAMRFTAESPRFVTMRHIGTDTNGLYLVMDYVTNLTLRSHVQSQPANRLFVTSATAILYELANALSDLHRLGFVHRDLKPENIFVQRIGGDQWLGLVCAMRVRFPRRFRRRRWRVALPHNERLWCSTARSGTPLEMVFVISSGLRMWMNMKFTILISIHTLSARTVTGRRLLY